jgi:hypothetical protein
MDMNVKTNGNVQQKLDDYLGLLDAIKVRTSDERTAGMLLQEISKDLRMDQIKQERELKNGEPATDKQRQFMKKLCIKFSDKVTKAEASAMIDEELAKS